MKAGRLRFRPVPAVLGLAVVALGFGMDLLVAHPAIGLGSLQRLLIAAGLALLPVGFLRGAMLAGYARGCLAVASFYVGAVLVEAFAAPPAALPSRTTLSLRGSVQPARWGGYELTPGWHGYYDDGIDRVEVVVNTLGDRDALPELHPAAAKHRALLLGDSFTFGIGLAQPDTIAARIEARSHGRVAAYNQGVYGYGPGDTLARYREHDVLRATDTFFLLYGNDLRADNCRAAIHTALDGLIVPATRPDETPFDEAALQAQIEAAELRERELRVTRLKSVLMLTELRRRLQLALAPDPLLFSGPPDEYSSECALAAARDADAMRSLARERAQRFRVVVVPNVVEAQLGRYSASMRECVDDLRRRGLSLVEVRDRLSPSDYFRHHDHLAAPGADKVAAAILEQLQ